jgi:hypothetical protein
MSDDSVDNFFDAASVNDESESDGNNVPVGSKTADDDAGLNAAANFRVGNNMTAGSHAQFCDDAESNVGSGLVNNNSTTANNAVSVNFCEAYSDVFGVDGHRDDSTSSDGNDSSSSDGGNSSSSTSHNTQFDNNNNISPEIQSNNNASFECSKDVAFHLISNNPLRKLFPRKSSKYTPANELQSRLHNNFQLLFLYVSRLYDLHLCFDWQNKMFTNCICLTLLSPEDVERLAHFLGKF